MAGTREPFWWSLFAAGGAVAALLAPVQIALTGIVVARGWAGQSFTYDRALALVSHPLSRLYLFVLISLPLFHWAHRFRCTLMPMARSAPSQLPSVPAMAALSGPLPINARV